MELKNLREALDELFDFVTDLPSGLDGFESDFDAAFGELKKAESAGRWIPVTERLPENSDVFLVCTKREYYGTQKVTKARFYGGDWHGQGGRWTNVTHWMPLPDAPKE